MTGFASIHGSACDDTIDTTSAGGRRDYIDAAGGNDTVVSGGGNDTIHAGAGRDLVYAGSGNDEAYGEAGRDTIYGGSGNDLIHGGGDNDFLFGEAGRDTIVGGAGADFIAGGAGNDVLTGDGSGAAPADDVFYYDSDFGDDVITDFDLTRDVLEIKGGINATSVHDPADLVPLVTEVLGNAVIAFANGDSITLQGITKDDLLADLDHVVRIV